MPPSSREFSSCSCCSDVRGLTPRVCFSSTCFSSTCFSSTSLVVIAAVTGASSDSADPDAGVATSLWDIGLLGWREQPAIRRANAIGIVVLMRWSRLFTTCLQLVCCTNATLSGQPSQPRGELLLYLLGAC